MRDLRDTSRGASEPSRHGVLELLAVWADGVGGQGERQRGSTVNRLPIEEGSVFGRLTVIGQASSRHGHRRYVCVCQCGNECTVYRGALRTGTTKACGCYPKGPQRRLEQRRADFMSKVAISTESDCWLWTGAQSSNRYGVVHIRPKNTFAHRVAYQLFVGPIPSGLLVCHRCDVKLCVRHDHLFLGTTSDNQRDSMSKGRTACQRGTQNPAKGEQLWNAKLSPATVRTIRMRFLSGDTITELAKAYGMSRSSIRAAATAETWSHVR